MVVMQRMKKYTKFWKKATLDRGKTRRTKVLIEVEPRLVAAVLGVVTSGGYGHKVRKTIAYGFLAPEHANHDDGYEIEVYDEVIPATHHVRALYDPERKKILM